MDLTAPLLLRPIVVPKPWGGHRLASLGRHDDHSTLIGESWDVSDLPPGATSVTEPVSRITGGPHDGHTLHDLLEAAPDDLLGTARRSPEGRFPLLVKLLDARESLSVQVHPPTALDPKRSKTESWVVLDAEPDAELLLGLRDGVTLQDVVDTIGTEAFVELCAPVVASPGDVIHLPAGTVHALGAGVLVAEVQTPSDSTHRLWDWPERRDGGRELHVEEGRRAIAAGWEHNHGVSAAGARDGLLIDSHSYSLRRETLTCGQQLDARSIRSVEIILVLEGALHWAAHGEVHVLNRTGVAVLPAACTTAITATTQTTQVLVARPA